MEVEPEDEIQDAVPKPAPERLPIPFKYREPPDRPRGTVIGLAVFADVMILLVGGLISLAINFQGFSESAGPKDAALADRQVSETLWLGGVVAVLLIATAAAAFWARADATGFAQCIFLVFVLLLTASTDSHLRQSAPQSPTSNYQPEPTSTSTFVPCYSGSNGPGCN